MVKFFICCFESTYTGYFKAVAFTDILLNLGLIAAGVYSIFFEFHFYVILYSFLTLIYIFFVISNLKQYYKKKQCNSKMHKCYALTRFLLLLGSLAGIGVYYHKTFVLVTNFIGEKRTECLIFFGVFSFFLFIYYLLNIAWSIGLFKVTYGARSGDEEEDSEEFLE